MRIFARPFEPAVARALAGGGLHPVMARIFAARGVRSAGELETAFTGLLPPAGLKGAQEAAAWLADLLLAERRLLVVADYDCDGATACAVALRGLRMLAAACGKQARVDYLVPNRFEYGYGLTPEIVELAARHPRQGKPDVLVTVDNGIASVDGVAAANALGIEVLVTDHHLPGDTLPAARCIVNPNQPGCGFASKNLAGVGVMFYVLLALRAELRARAAFVDAEPRLDALLDLVALGTVADVVKLDANNRILVAQGLQRIRARRMQPGVAALLRVAGRDAAQVSGMDLGFAVGPRVNAAGRLADMGLGIECLLTDDAGRAQELAAQLDAINRERRDIEAGMQEEALRALEHIEPADNGLLTLSVYKAGWHQGVIGILASRLRERFHRPVIVFADAGENGANGDAGDSDAARQLRGSGRSIPGFHLRDALDLVSKRHPGLLGKFGGHAMAAGLSLAASDLERFTAAFEAVGAELLDDALLSRVCETDGELDADCFDIRFAAELDSRVWGQGFPPPVFSGVFQVRQQTLLKEKHLRLTLEHAGKRIPAIWFNHAENLPERARIAYRVSVNRYNGMDSLQLMVEHAEAA
ncbi:MAG: single-stranded-DNA-specific exonuclease RecJ [Candidatus Protistobacter heckmanni]|nr:single-stranded-DNA-specific exonuclease RecJ [Candidatus Protistobacter heckmanni]